MKELTAPLFITVPHAGETVPAEADWLVSIPPLIMLTDPDRFVDQLYKPVIDELSIPSVVARVHRYAVDLNRYPDDVDADSVEGSKNPSGKFGSGFHWVRTTQGVPLMSKPISQKKHETLVRKYHDSFHDDVAAVIARLQEKFQKREIFHLDCHSMPSQGTDAHQDSGKSRAEVVVSDLGGKSSSAAFKDAVTAAFHAEGFEVAYNWPYQGGRITQRYGQPAQGHHTIQIELNRKLYMDEQTKEKLPEFAEVQKRLGAAVQKILASVKPRAF